MIAGEFVERKLEVGNSWSGVNSGKFARWVPLFNLIFLLRLSQSFSNCCFFFCLLSPFLPALRLFCLAWVRIKSEWEQCTRIMRPPTQVLFVQCNKFTKFLDKKVFLCSSDFFVFTFYSQALFFSFLHVCTLRGNFSSRAQLHPATYHYTQTLHQCFDLTLKLLGFYFLNKMISVLGSHQVSWQVLHTRACSCRVI